jgi:RIO-like serine/threonine protein kinase
MYTPDPTLGVKILKVKHYSQKVLLNSAEMEYDNAYRLYSIMPDLFPKPVSVISTGESYGILMEHIPMDTLKVVNRDYPGIDINTVTQQIKEELEQAGILHSDMHGGNILYNPNTGDFKVIDCDPEFICIGEGDDYKANSSRSCSIEYDEL